LPSGITCLNVINLASTDHIHLGKFHCILKDPNLIFRIRNKFWKVNTEIDPDQSTTIQSRPIPGEVNNFVINPPSPKSKQFQEVGEMFNRLPETHRQELATSIGFGGRRKSHRPTDIDIPVYVPDNSYERTYNPAHFTMMPPVNLPPQGRKRRAAEAFEAGNVNMSATTAHLATGTLRQTILGSSGGNFRYDPPPHTSTPYQPYKFTPQAPIPQIETPFKTPPESPPNSEISVNSRLFRIQSRPQTPTYDGQGRIIPTAKFSYKPSKKLLHQIFPTPDPPSDGSSSFNPYAWSDHDGETFLPIDTLTKRSQREGLLEMEEKTHHQEEDHLEKHKREVAQQEEETLKEMDHLEEMNGDSIIKDNMEEDHQEIHQEEVEVEVEVVEVEVEEEEYHQEEDLMEEYHQEEDHFEEDHQEEGHLEEVEDHQDIFQEED